MPTRTRHEHMSVAMNFNWSDSAPLLLIEAAIPAALVKDRRKFGGRDVADCLKGDLFLQDGRVRAFIGQDETPSDAHVVDLKGRILMPRLTEPHCHLDKCHTIDRLGSVGGDLHAAIEAQRGDRMNHSREDVLSRAGRGLSDLAAAGCGTVRSHVDWNEEATPRGEAPLSWQVLGDLADTWSDRLLLQRAALLTLELFDDEAYVSAAARRIAADDGVLGVFVFDQDDKARRLRRVLEVADRYDLALDFHVDEGLREGLDGLITIAKLISETGFTNPVLCGHACSLMNAQGPELQRAIDIIARAEIAVVALPVTNLYLQGRGDGTPERRGVTRVRELKKAGVTVAFGTDNVGDAFCPLGRHDPMTSLVTGALAAHLDPPYGPWLELITTDARKALGLDPEPVDVLDASSLLVSEARHTAELIAGAPLQSLTSFMACHPDRSTHNH